MHLFKPARLGFVGVILLTTAAGDALALEPVKSIAVLPLQVKGKSDKALGPMLDDLLLSSLQQAVGSTTRVLGQSDMAAVVGFERTKDVLSCDAVSCAVDLAGALGVDSLMYGSLSKLGKSYILSLSWIRQNDATVINRHSETVAADDDQLSDGVKRAVATLTKSSLPIPTPSAHVPASDPLAAWEILNGTWYAADGAIYGSGGEQGGHIAMREAPRNYRLSVTAELVSGPDSNTLGVGWRNMVIVGGTKRMRNSTADIQCYAVNFSFSGLWKVFRGLGGNWYALEGQADGWTTSPSFNRKKNRVVVEVRDSKHKVMVNGSEIFGFEEGSLPVGTPLLAVHYANSVVRFTEIRVEPL